jgi:hypothetical protein
MLFAVSGSPGMVVVVVAEQVVLPDALHAASAFVRHAFLSALSPLRQARFCAFGNPLHVRSAGTAARQEAIAPAHVRRQFAAIATRGPRASRRASVRGLIIASILYHRMSRDGHEHPGSRDERRVTARPAGGRGEFPTPRRGLDFSCNLSVTAR